MYFVKIHPRRPTIRAVTLVGTFRVPDRLTYRAEPNQCVTQSSVTIHQKRPPQADFFEISSLQIAIFKGFGTPKFQKIRLRRAFRNQTFLHLFIEP